MDQVVRLAEQFRNKARDYCDERSNPKAQQLLNSLEQLYDEAKSRRDPDLLFERVRGIESQVQNLKNGTVYSPHHLDDMYDRCQDLKQLFRQLS